MMTRDALHYLWLPAVAGVLLSVVGCDARPPRTRDGGQTEDSSVPTTGCAPAAADYLHCYGGQALECRADGTEAGRTDCTLTGQVCNEGHGCGACHPNTFQCTGNDVQQCNAEGTAWTTVMTCDAAAGQACNATVGACTSACDDAARNQSYIGCEYWPVTTLNSQVEPEFQPAIVIANPQTTAANVTVTGPGGFSQTRSIAPGAIDTVELAWVDTLKGTIGEEASAIVRGGAYHVVSTLPVTVYQFNPLEYRIDTDCDGELLSGSGDPFDGQCFSFSNDASLLLPSHVLTGNYIVLSRPTLSLDQGFGPSSSPGFFTVVGASPTAVTVSIQFRGRVVASADGAVSSYAPGSSGTFTLNQGDVLQIVGAAPSSCTPAGSESGVTYCNVGSDYDLTGTEIRATGPVQVIAGHNCDFVPFNRWACDHLEEALFPLEAWGMESIVSKTQPPMGRTEPNIVRIVSGRDGNTITFDPASVGSSRTLNRGEYFEIEASQSFRVSGTQAIMVGQFLVGQDYAGIGTSGDMGQGDPSMSLGIPSEQFRTQYSFLAPTSYLTNFVGVTAPSGATVTLDGSPVSGFQPIGGTGFSSAQVTISGGQHTISSDQKFGIVVYGYGQYTSYMYPGGLDLNSINIPF